MRKRIFDGEFPSFPELWSTSQGAMIDGKVFVWLTVKRSLRFSVDLSLSGYHLYALGKKVRENFPSASYIIIDICITDNDDMVIGEKTLREFARGLTNVLSFLTRRGAKAFVVSNTQGRRAIINEELSSISPGVVFCVAPFNPREITDVRALEEEAIPQVRVSVESKENLRNKREEGPLPCCPGVLKVVRLCSDDAEARVSEQGNNNIERIRKTR